jgi:hypothetical protein
MNIRKMDDNNGFLIEKRDSNHLVVIFGGINQGIGIPVFEFFNILNNKKSDKLFIRDFNQMWYLNGVDSDIFNFSKLKIKLNDKIKDYDKVSFVGNSMGGYAAILFGVLLNVDEVVAFSPQTFISSFYRFWFLDIRWRKQINRIHKAKLYSEYYDLKTVLKNHTEYTTSINLHYCSANRLDRIHSTRLKSLRNIHLISYPNGGHGLVKELKKTGELQQILNQL